MSTRPIAYTYDADVHCPACACAAGYHDWGTATLAPFTGNPNRPCRNCYFITLDIEDVQMADSEGNPVGVITSIDEWWEPSDAVSILACGDCGEELDRIINEDAVRTIGQDAGKAAASWVEVDGPEFAVQILTGCEDGDPEILDYAPAPLSGEWAGESIPELSARFDLPLSDDEVAELFEAGFSDGYWAEVLRVCRDILTGSTYFERFDIAEAFSVWCAEWADASDPYWVAKSGQLRRIGFGPRANLSRSTLTANSLGILLRLEAKRAAA